MKIIENENNLDISALVQLLLEQNIVYHERYICVICTSFSECVETKGVVVDKKSYLCDFCTPSTRQQVTKPLMSKMLKT